MFELTLNPSIPKTAPGSAESLAKMLSDGLKTGVMASEGALATFEIELDEITGKWQIRPTSRPL